MLKIRISIYFIKSVFIFILNIVSINLYHENELMNTDAFYLQEIKRGNSLAPDIVIYLSSSLYVAVTAKFRNENYA